MPGVIIQSLKQNFEAAVTNEKEILNEDLAEVTIVLLYWG